MMGVSRTRPEPGAHPRYELRFAHVSDQDGMPLQNVDELVLFGMGMSKSGDRTRFQTREVDSEVGQTEQIAEHALLSTGYA
jgi:hypothetical protein